MNKTNEEVQAGVTRYWKRVASQNNMTVDEYHAYRKAQAEQRRKEWGLSMAAAMTVDDAQSLHEYASQLVKAANNVWDLSLIKICAAEMRSIDSEAFGESICELHDKLRLVTAVLDRIDENRH